MALLFIGCLFVCGAQEIWGAQPIKKDIVHMQLDSHGQGTLNQSHKKTIRSKSEKSPNHGARPARKDVVHTELDSLGDIEEGQRHKTIIPSKKAGPSHGQTQKSLTTTNKTTTMDRVRPPASFISQATKGHDYRERSLVADEGNGVGDKAGASLADCKKICDETKTCKSFAFNANGGRCFLKDKQVSESAAASTKEGAEHYKTYYYRATTTTTTKAKTTPEVKDAACVHTSKMWIVFALVVVVLHAIAV